MGMTTPIRIRMKLLPYQKALLRSRARYCGLIGGTGCGKSWFAPRWLYVRMCEHPGHEWIVSAPTIPMMKRNPIKYVVDFYDANSLEYQYNQSDSWITTTQGKIHFISAQNADRMQGIHAKGIIGDEAGLYGVDWWDTAIQRVAFHSGQILLVTTPYALNWLKAEVYDRWVAGDADYHVENPRSIDNPEYDVAEYERAKRRLPTWKFKMLFDGQFTKPAGLIYEDLKVCPRFEIPGSWLRFRGVDFGYNDPFACVWLAQDPDSGVFYVYQEFRRSEMSIDEVFRIMRPERDVQSYGDPASKETLMTLKRWGIRMKQARKDVVAGLMLVIGLFRAGKLFIFDDLRRTIDEMNSYQWALDSSGEILEKPEKKNDHLMDALRYALFSVAGNAQLQILDDSDLDDDPTAMRSGYPEVNPDTLPPELQELYYEGVDITPEMLAAHRAGRLVEFLRTQ